MRPPARRVAFKAAAVSALTLPHSACILCRRRVVGFDRQERARPDMQRHPMQSDAALAQRGGRGFGEMQPRGRRRDRAFLAREHGLIIGAIVLVDLAAAGDIGRQRHVAALGQRLSSAASVKAKASVTSPPSLAFLLDRGVELFEETDAAFAAEAHDVAGHRAASPA